MKTRVAFRVWSLSVGVEMLIDEEKRIKDTEVEEKDIDGVLMKVLIGTEQGAPNFVMRVFDLEKDGHTAYHTHEWEHEVYVLEGDGAIIQKGVEFPIHKGSFALIKPEEEHQFVNKGGGHLRFICVVPLMQ
jgi:quercetin dioxygenase-like cupin family protein